MSYRTDRQKAVHEAIKGLRRFCFLDRYTVKLLRPTIAIAFERGAEAEIHKLEHTLRHSK